MVRTTCLPRHEDDEDMKKHPAKHGGPHNSDHALLSQSSDDTDGFFTPDQATNLRVGTLPS